jgi:signal transduction histidine kinase
MQVIRYLLDVHGTDPDDVRRRRLLNILLASTAVLSALSLLFALVAGIAASDESESTLPLAIASAATFLGAVLMYLINRHLCGWLASTVFLLALTIGTALADTPQEVVGGRTLFMLVIPILIASVLLRPWASFVWAGLASLLIAAIEIFALQSIPNVVAMLGFLLIALVAWLSARDLEQALRELRTVNRDLDRRVAERTEELQKANERLHELDELKSTFVARVSHELRTPLNAILGYADMLHQGVYGTLDERQREASERIIANVGHLSAIVNDLLDIARIEAGEISFHAEHFSPGELILHLQGKVAPRAEAKGLALTTTIAEDMPVLLYGDRRRVGQILTNLVSNSIKFTEQGSIEVRVRRSDNLHCTIDITDTGPGIPEEAQSLVFEPFHQVDDSQTRKHGGAGLGLPIAKHLAIMMGGDIALHSQVGRGSTFSVTLPLIPPHAQGESQS